MPHDPKKAAGLSLHLVLPIAALTFTLAVPGATLGDIDELDDDLRLSLPIPDGQLVPCEMLFVTAALPTAGPAPSFADRTVTGSP